MLVEDNHSDLEKSMLAPILENLINNQSHMYSMCAHLYVQARQQTVVFCFVKTFSDMFIPVNWA